jgi:rhodanese-related sulfurtransferase
MNMNDIKFIFFSLLVFIVACSNANTNEKNTDSVQVSENKVIPELPADSKLLLGYLNETGDYVNSREFPSLIKASIVFDELNKKNLIIDIRKPELYKKGHIKGAVNVNFTDIPEYFQSKIKPFEYDKIIMVCSTGQNASYTTALLRLMGYGNVYAMRWGMSAWSKEIAKENWLAGLSSEYEKQLETNDIAKPDPGKFPEMNLNLKTGEETLQARIKEVFKAGLDSTIIMANSVFKNPKDYFIINFERKDKYDAGHIPGAIRYKPTGTLGIVEEMSTIAADKKIVVYCGTGHNSAFVTAYLNLFGYMAQSLDYGNNSFMHDKMIKDKATLSWVSFTEGDIANYPVVK